jgi:hypothetical protein
MQLFLEVFFEEHLSYTIEQRCVVPVDLQASKIAVELVSHLLPGNLFLPLCILHVHSVPTPAACTGSWI